MAQKTVLVVMHRVATAAEHRRINEPKLTRRIDMRPGIIKDRVCPGCYCRERPNAQSQGKHGGDCQSRRSTQLAKGETQGLQVLLQSQTTPLATRNIRDQRNITKLPHGFLARIGRRFAAGNVIFGSHAKMAFEFLRQIILTPKHIPQRV